MSDCNHETHVSTLGRFPQAYARFSSPLAHACWAGGASGAAGEGPSSSSGLSTRADFRRGAACQAFRVTDRLSRTDDFSSVFASRRALRSEHFQLLYSPAGLDRARLGVVVAKKLARRAVDRNMIKRLAREAFRISRARLPAYDLVLRLAADLAGSRKLALRGEIDGLLQRLPK